MIIIGENINGTRKVINDAILGRNSAYIEQIAIKQSEAGADYLDINAGTSPDREKDDMLWLLEIVQNVTDVPICIDSSSPDTLKAALEFIKKMPLVNSINADPHSLESFIPYIKEKGCPVIALALDESSSNMPKNNDERMENIGKIITVTRSAGISDDKIFIDPLIMSVSTDDKAGMEVFECIRIIKETYPDTHITGGLSNISFGLPRREIVNRTFLTLAMAAGLDSAVCDPTNKSLIESLKATDMLLGKDRFCRKYTIAARNDFARK